MEASPSGGSSLKRNEQGSSSAKRSRWDSFNAATEACHGSRKDNGSIPSVDFEPSLAKTKQSDDATLNGGLSIAQSHHNILVAQHNRIEEQDVS